MAKGKRQRVSKAKVLAYPADWFWCYGFGLVCGIVGTLAVCRGAG